MVKIKEFIIYALALIAGHFCGKWAMVIAKDTFNLSSPSYLQNKLLIPTNLTAGIDFLVTVIVLFVCVELIKKSGLIK